MIYPYGSIKFPTPFSDSAVDNIIDQDGVIDQFSPISLDISDEKLIENINQRIDDSKNYYNDATGFNLEENRAEALRMYLGIQADSADFYEQEEPYIENQIRRAVDSIVAYATARTPQSVCVPGQDTPQARKFATNLEKAHNAHSVAFDLRGMLEIVVRSWILNKEGDILLEFDPDHGEHGEIIPKFIPCDEIVYDKNARFNENPSFITIYEKRTVEYLIYTYPEKRQKIFESVGIKMGDTLDGEHMAQEMVIKKTWFTYYADGKSKEGVCVHFNDVMLGKWQDINWLEGRKNFLQAPMKPIITLNVINDGKHLIDFSSPLEDGIRMQKLLNARGRQINMNAARSNGTTVVDGKGSGLKKEDVEDWTGGPNERIYLKKKMADAKIQDVIYQIPGNDVKPFIINAQTDIRNQLGEVMSVPIDQTGNDLSGDDPTLGQTLLKKTNDNARQDMIVRALDRFLYKYFNMLTQMMFVWYDEDHFFPWLDEDGSFERIVIKRYYFDEGMQVSVKGQSTIAFDKNREQAMMIHFVDKGMMSNLDAYRIAGFENYQKLYDNWAKQQKSPFELVRDANDAYDDGDAYSEFLEIMAGKDPAIKDDVGKDFIMTFRKLSLTDIYMKAKEKVQLAYQDRLDEYMQRYELRTSLDQLSQVDFTKITTQNGQLQPPQPPQQFQQMMQPPQQPPMPPGGPPPGPPQPGQMQPPGFQPGSAALGGGASPSGLFNGTPIMNPAAAQTPSGVSAIPSI